MSTTEPVDVMIIGSGFGGAVSALRLAEQGIDTVLLERGQRWPLTDRQDTFSSLQNPDGRSAWLSDVALLGDPKPIDRFVGVLELTLGDRIATFAGAGVGGGSLVYAGVLLQPSKALFDGVLGTEVDYDEMDDVYYPRVREVIKPEPLPRRILNRREYAGARSWMQLGEAAGLPTQPVDCGLDWDVVFEELTRRRVPSVIAGDFWYGNNSGAKQSLDRNYLRLAEESGHLDVVTRRNVRTVEEGPDGRFLVTADEIADDGTVLREHRYAVRKLFLAAGSVGTSKLLVRAKATGGLPGLNDRVGTAWGNNGDFFSALEGFSRVQPNLGGTAPILIQDHGNELTPTSVECFADWTREGDDGVVPAVGMAPTPAKGWFTYEAAADEVVLHWPHDDPEVLAAVEAGEATFAKLAEAGGRRPGGHEPVASVAYGSAGRRPEASPGRGRPDTPPGRGRPDTPPGRGRPETPPGRGRPGTPPGQRPNPEPTPVDASATAHPLGGVPLGGATDNLGAVEGYAGLYVIDGALVPGNTGCANPALTIAALAERNIERIIARDFG